MCPDVCFTGTWKSYAGSWTLSATAVVRTAFPGATALRSCDSFTIFWTVPSRSRSIGRRLTLARAILESHYAQPATAIWRLFESEVILEHFQASGRGLDLGCGDGTLAAVLFARVPGVRWIGLDIDPSDALLASKRGVYESVHTAPATAIPEPDGSFDVVFSNSVLEHVEQLDDVVDEVRRVLRPGGRLVFTVPFESFRRELFWPRLSRSAGARRLATRYVAALDRRIAHVNYLSADGWRDLLRRHGFAMTLCVPYLSRRVIGIWETLANATGGVAYLAARGRIAPRRVLQKAGTAGHSSRALGAAAFLVLLPILVVAASERHPFRFGCLYIEAERRP